MTSLMQSLIRSMVLGIVTTVAVAWFCAAFLELRQINFDFQSMTSLAPPCWVQSYYHRPGACRAASQFLPQRDSSFAFYVGQSKFWRKGCAWCTLPDFPPSNEWSTSRFKYEDRRGWPFPALSYTIDAIDSELVTRPAMYRVTNGIPLKPSKGKKDILLSCRALPTKPIALFFLADTGLFSLFWFASFQIPKLALRWMRKRKCRCLVCGYDRQHLVTNICPECGTSDKC